MNVETVHKVLVIRQRLLCTLIGQRQSEGQGGVVEREGRGTAQTTRHVGDTVMDHPVDHIGRVVVRGRTAGLEATALVDGNIHQAARLAKKEIKLMARDTTCHIYTAMTPVWRLIERIERCLISETGVHATASNQGE